MGAGLVDDAVSQVFFSEVDLFAAGFVSSPVVGGCFFDSVKVVSLMDCRLLFEVFEFRSESDVLDVVEVALVESDLLANGIFMTVLAAIDNRGFLAFFRLLLVIEVAVVVVVSKLFSLSDEFFPACAASVELIFAVVVGALRFKSL